MADNIAILTDATYDEEVKSADQPVLVDFWAEWCGPCRALAPVLEEIAGEKTGTLRIAKVDVDANPGLTSRFEVQSIPTMVLLTSEGEALLRVVGAKSKAQLLADITPYLD
jgi:thioredoxin 1